MTVNAGTDILSLVRHVSVKRTKVDSINLIEY